MLEWLAAISPRHEAELHRLRWAEAEAEAEAKKRHDRELLEWLATISDKHERELHALLQQEAEKRESLERSRRFVEGPTTEAEWVEADHPRQPKGTPVGGEWVKNGDAGGASAAGGESPKSSGFPATHAAPVPLVVTKQQLPADSRGTWISGTKGDGVFR